MNIVFAESLLLRTPAKSWKYYCDIDRQEILNDPFFQLALYLASPGFFEKVSRADFMYERLSERERITVERYFNRISYRPTPFGLFAAVSLISWGGDTRLPGPGSPFRLTALPDQTYVMLISRDLLSKELAGVSHYQSNYTLYRSANEYRFIRTAVKSAKFKREYLLQSTAFSKSLKDLLFYCSTGRSKADIIQFIVATWHCSPEEGGEYFEFLADAQLLVNTLGPNITGQHYLQRLLQQISAAGTNNYRTRLLNEAFGLLSSPKIRPSYFKDISRSLQALLPKSTEIEDSDYPQFNVILRREFEGKLNRKYQEQIRDGLFALDCLCPDDCIPSLAGFAKAFEKHFEGQSLPLLAALDPETGVGYLERSSAAAYPLLETVNIQHSEPTPNMVNWTAAHACLLDRWQKIRGEKVPVIRLVRSDLDSLNAKNGRTPLQGLSVLFRILKEGLYLESAGGVNAPALMGRFTVTGGDIRDAAVAIARAQESANPDIIFAELLHLSDPHVDNVNHREKIWSWELPVTATSSNDAGRQLELSDLLVSIENNKVILRSAKHHKMVIPRLTSAYNHSINKLPLFRFLADVSYQFGRSNLSLDLRQYFPGVSFYPAVEYKGTILHLATWILNETEIASLQMREAPEIIAAFERLCSAIGLPAMFSLSEGDQQLIFNREAKRDRLFFAACVRQKKEAVIKEFHPERLDSGLVNQFNAFVYSTVPINVPAHYGVPASRIRLRRKFVPGSEWLYLKIYSPKVSAAKLLLRMIPLLRKKWKHGKVKRWFFIRYEDHAPHIRLRMQISPDDIGELLVTFKNKLEDGINQHVIREYQVDTYSRELERYAVAGMERTEDFFWASSELVISFLRQNRFKMVTAAHHFALYTTQIIVSELIPEAEDQLAFLLESYGQFLPEISGEKPKVELDRKYRELSQEIQYVMQTADPSLWSGSVTAGKRFLQMLQGLRQNLVSRQDNKRYYLRSIIHMHLNRLFTEEARKQEMVTYYLLYKYRLSVKGRNKG
jgi:thiopeptide-type bacteriocin biosynthesis protein